VAIGEDPDATLILRLRQDDAGALKRSRIVRRAMTHIQPELTPRGRPTGTASKQDVYFEAAERARRLDVLQRAEHEFDPIPFDADAARAYGRVTAAVIAAGRKPRRRAVDLMIAATAIAAELPLYTTNPGDFAGLDHLVTVIPVTGPEVPNER
jgi:predicted nucleic acid-binding protein